MGIKTWWPLLFIGSIVLACVLIFPSDLRLANLLGKAGRVDEAILSYQKVLAKEPGRRAVRVELGKLYVMNEEPQKAVVEFETAIEDVPGDQIVLNHLYRLYSEMANKGKIVRTLERIVEVAPEDQTYRVKLADAYEWNGDFEKAIASYNELLSNNPDDLTYLNKLVSLSLNEQKYPECISYLDRIATLEPENREAKILLGNIYLETGQRQLAASEFERALRLQPDDEALRARLAELYLWYEDYERGTLHYESLLMSHVLKDEYFDKLIALTENGAPDKAIKYFQYRLKYLPQDTTLRARYVNLNVHLGRTDEAVRQLRDLIGKYPGERRFRKQLAQLYRSIQEPQLAIAVVEDTYGQGFKDREVTDELIPYYQTEKQYDKLMALVVDLQSEGLADEELLSDYADLLVLTNNYAEAISIYTDLLARTPGNSETRLALASLHRLTGDPQKSYTLFRRGLEDFPFQEEKFLLEAGEFFSENGDLPSSVRAYERIFEQKPESRYYQRLLAEGYIKAGRYDKAAQFYERMILDDSENLELRFSVASLHWLENDLKRTRETIDEIERSHRQQESIHRDIGKFYFERGFLTEAIAHLKTELRSTPNDSASLRMLGLAYAWNNEPAKAKTVLRNYHELYPSDYYTHYQLGELLFGEGKKKGAWRQFEAALTLIKTAPRTRESATTEAKIYARQNVRVESISLFEELLHQYPDDPDVYLEYAESLLNLKDYSQSDAWLDKVLAQAPNNYRALRLQSRSYFEQGRYREAANILSELALEFPGDTGLRTDLADVELAAGNWHRSKKELKAVLEQYPETIPVYERLLLLRRNQPEALAADYRAEQQSNNYLKQIYNAVFSKAQSSLFSVKLWLGQERYSRRDLAAAEQAYQNLGANASSRFGSRLQSSVSAIAQRHETAWNLSGKGSLRWNFNQSNSFSVSGQLNELWRDPIIAAFFDGRVNSLQSDLSLLLLKKIILWNRLTYESHQVNQNQFGTAFRNSFVAGYQWLNQPGFSTYYQYYQLHYKYQNAANSAIIAIPERETVHSLGATLNHQLSRRLFYELGGSLGYNEDQRSLLFYGTLDLEFMLFKDLRLRSHFAYGNQNRLANNDNFKALSLDLYYFY